MNNNSIITVNDEIKTNTPDENTNDSPKIIVQELLKFNNRRLNRVIVSAVIMKIMDCDKKHIDENVEYLSKFMSAVIEMILKVDDPQGILIEFLNKCIKVPPELEEKIIEMKKDDKIVIRKFNECIVLDFSKESKDNETTKCFLPLPDLFKTTEPKSFIEVLLNAILNSTSLPRKHSNFKELADLRSIEICQSEVFDQIVSYVYDTTLLPYVTVILEIHNNSVFPNLRALSILFMWFFCISQLRFIEGIGIFIAVALMNSTYEKLNEHARAVWIAHVAQFVSVMLPFAEYLESYDSSESQKSLNNFKLQDIKDASYIVYDVPTSYFNEQEQIVLAKELCGMSKISDYDPKKFEKMSKMLDIDSSMLDELKNDISKINK
ncbi:hypothetical protein C2G38_2159688 [Gigaspora rosea]|uniref:Uncharacterized protein n=1 Tax=Gigaspora rosea TaxID=44941 RepID=A0A397VZ73_9GLOM|nr:hypothetical protein C2G38_2159688 [Gigaspora rosea]